MTTRWVALALCGAIGCLTAGPTSLLDPRVTLTAVETPLSEVLAELSGQTGFRFSRSFAQLRGQASVPADDPPVTLTVIEEPLRQVITELELLLGLEFQANGPRGDYLLIPASSRPAAQPAPGVALGPYQLQLHGLRIEHLRQRVWSRPPVRLNWDRLTVTLTVDAPTNLAWFAVHGIEQVAAEVDGSELTPVDRGPRHLRLDGGTGRTFSFDFTLDGYDPSVLTRLAGELVVADEARELVFEFADLEVPQQRLSDGEVDLTLMRFRRGAVSGQPVAGPLPRADGSGAWLAEFEVTVPVRSGLEPAMQTRVTAAAADPAPLWLGPAPAAGGLMPQVAGELADGRKVRAAPAAWREIRRDEGHLTFTFTAMFGADEPPRRLWAALIDYGESIERYGFELSDIELLAGERD